MAILNFKRKNTQIAPEQAVIEISVTSSGISISVGDEVSFIPKVHITGVVMPCIDKIEIYNTNGEMTTTISRYPLAAEKYAEIVGMLRGLN